MSNACHRWRHHPVSFPSGGCKSPPLHPGPWSCLVFLQVHLELRPHGNLGPQVYPLVGTFSYPRALKSRVSPVLIPDQDQEDE